MLALKSLVNLRNKIIFVALVVPNFLGLNKQSFYEAFFNLEC